MSDIVVAERVLPVLADPREWAERRRDFNAWVNTQLRKGVDFGEIPGIDKPTLFKSGAEKIAQAYGCSPVAEITNRQQDVATGYMYVEVVVRLIHIQTGAVIATGLGACSSFESKYRWRWEWWNGKGAPTGDDWEPRGSKFRRRVQNADLIDQWNTVVKMAKKRALVDATLTVSGASELFTQDVEDMPELADDKPEAPRQAEVPKAKGPIESPPLVTTQIVLPSEPAPWTADPKALARLWAWTGEQGLTHENVHNALGVESVKAYAGTMAEAKQAILDWVKAQSA